MKFKIPEDLSPFSITGLERFRADADAEYNEIFASVSGETVTDEQLADLDALREFSTTVETEIASRNTRLERFALLTAEPAVETVVEDAPVVEVTTKIGDTVVASTAAVITPTLADIVAPGSTKTTSVPEEAPKYGSLIASADVPNHTASQPLENMLAVANAFLERTAGYRGLGEGTASHGVAVFKRDYPDGMNVFGASEEQDMKILEHAIDESRLPGGSLVKANRITAEDVENKGASLVAAVGWCAPSTTIYDTCLQVTSAGLASFPEVGAPRGGVRHNTGLDFSTIFGDGTGFFNYSESQIISGVSKPCLTINCPSFTDTRLGVTGLCLTGNILQNRAYPEYVATFIRGALATSAHQINMLQIAAVVSGSTAVDLTASAPFVGDNTVVSQIFAGLDMAAMDERYRLRLDPTANLETKLPFWVLAQMRADWSRRNAESNPNMADAVISNWFSVRNITPDFVYDWQDAFSASGVGPGASSAITTLPTQLVFTLYPTGTWVRLVSDVITLNSIYDSTKLASNQVTQLFTEQGWAMAQMCPLSRAYTINICPTGETGGQRVSTNTITC